MRIRCKLLSELTLCALLFSASLMPVLQVSAIDDFASLLASIQAANKGGSASVVLTGDVVLEAALPQISGDLTIDGQGNAISGSNQFRIFDVIGGSLTVKHVTLTAGNTSEANGGAIRLQNGARLTMENTSITDSVASNGGAIATSSPDNHVVISDSQFLRNIALKSAGALLANGGVIHITNSNFEKNCGESASNQIIVDQSGNPKGAERRESRRDSDGCIHSIYEWSRPQDIVDIESDGGAIRLLNGAQVLVEETRFSDNQASSGGAIANSSRGVELIVKRSDFTGNRGLTGAGAISADYGNTTITYSSFVRNASKGGSAAVSVRNSALSISNSTLGENLTEGHGGALDIAAPATVTVTHVTFMDNRNPVGPDAISNAGGRLLLYNSLIGGRSGSVDCQGPIGQSIGNISEDGSCGQGIRRQPLLGELTGTPSHYPLLENSPAVDAAEPVYCLPFDQMGTPRPQGANCDIGAIEKVDDETLEPPPPCPLSFWIIAANVDTAVAGCPAGQGADTISLSRNITLISPLPPVTSNITIEGNGHTISGNGQFRIFDVHSGQLTINDLTMTQGNARADGGGGIRLQGGEAVINHSHFVENKGKFGGAIFVDGRGTSFQKLTVRNSSFVNNQARVYGGAIEMYQGAGVISNSSFIANRAAEAGGAIRLYDSSRLDVENSIFSRNNGGWSGGAVNIGWRASATFTHVTMFRDYARGGGDGIYVSPMSSSVRLRNSIIAGGRLESCLGKLTQNVGNLIQYGSCAPQLSDDPMLEDATGSPAQMAPQAGSPAIGAADPRFCPETDQLGRPRALVGPCDIGAIETVPVSRALSDCAVTTIHVLNFRETPGGAKIGQVQYNRTLSATARTAGWFQVEYRGAPGWISADYVVTEGECG